MRTPPSPAPRHFAPWAALAAVLAGASAAGAQSRPATKGPPLPQGAGTKAGDPNRPVLPPFFGEIKPPEPFRPKPRPRPTTRPATTPAATRPTTRPATTQPATRPKPGPPATQPIPWAPAPLSDRVGRAIRRGLDALYAAQRPDGTWDSKYASQQPGGVEAMVLWAALSAGEPANHPRLAAALKHIDGLQPEPRTTYVRAARALAYSRLPAAQYLEALQEDVTWLAGQQQSSGGWGYGPGYRNTRDNPSWTDLSNTFLALRALSEAEARGAKVPPNAWSRARIYLSRAANADGGLGYQPPGGVGFRLRGSSYGSMTAAGLVSMGLLSDKAAAIDEADFLNAGTRRRNPSPFQKHIERGLAWLGGSFELTSNPRWVWGWGEAYEYYYLWCLQQLASQGGLDRIGGKPFVRDAAELVIARQRPDGGWRDPRAAEGAEDRLAVIRTCLALLSLLEAREPVLIEKLALGETADCDGRDAANLAQWLGRSVHSRGAWRRVTGDASADGPALAPLLYVQTSLADYPAALDAVAQRFVAGGGTLVVQPFAGEEQAAQAAIAWLRRAFPAFAHGPVTDSHPIFTVHFKVLPGTRPKMYALGDACRTRVFVFQADVGGAWHQGRSKEFGALFQLGANLLLYTTDLAPPPGRLEAGEPRPRPAKPARSVPVARIKWDGPWDLCPKAMERLGDVLAEAVSVGVQELPPAALDKPVDSAIPLLWLTGTRDLKLSAEQKARLKDYLAVGGMLFVDAALGDMEAASAAASLLSDVAGGTSLEPLAADHPLLTGEFAGGMGSDVTKVRFTRAAAAEVGDVQAPRLMALRLDGRIAAILSPYAVTCPLSGQPVYRCKGLAAPDAARLAANVVLYAATRQTERQAP